MKLLRLKRITAIMLVIVVCVMCSACGKTKKEEKDGDGQLADYRIYAEETQDFVIGYPTVIDNVMYGYYTEDIYGAHGKPSYGLFKYDLILRNSEFLKLNENVSNVQYMYADEAGNLVVCVRMNEQENTDLVKYETYVYDTDFELISENEEIKVSGADLTGEVIGIYVCNDKLVKVVEISDTGHNIIIEDKSGNELEKIEFADMYFQFIQTDSDSFAVLTNDLSECKLYRFKPSEENNADKQEASGTSQGYSMEEISEIKNEVNVSIYPKNENEILLDSGGYLSILDMNTGKPVRVLNYADTGISGSDVTYVYGIDENTYALVLYDYKNANSRIALITSQGVVQEKREIYLATIVADNDLESRVVAFNNASDEYKIIIKDYYDNNGSLNMTKEEADKAIEQFNLDILTGNGADIISLGNGYIDIKQYADKGVFEDLAPYLERDRDISEGDFVQNVLDACRVSGKLYTLSPSFDIRALAGAKSRIGDEISWTAGEFIDYVNQLPEGVEVMGWITSENLLSVLLDYNFDEFIDWEKNQCNFNSDEFIAILELCGGYMTNEEHYEYIQNGNVVPGGISGIRNHQVELYQCNIHNIGDYLEMNEIFEEDITIKGYPTGKGTGIGITLSGNYHYAINSKSKYKEAAWDFIKSFFTYDEQMSSFGLPIIEKALDDKLEGEKTRETNLYLPEAPDGTEYYGALDDGTVTIYYKRPTDEDIKRVKELISLAEKPSENYSSEIFDIIEEEAEVYFTGQKSAKEVADVIQSRVSIYVNERN